MRDSRRHLTWHWVAIALIVTYWAWAFAVCAWQLSGKHRGESGYTLQFFAPIVAGCLTVLIGGSKRRAMLLGALIGIVDFNVLNAINYPLQPPAARGNLGLIFLGSIPFFGGIAAALGFVGASAGRLLRRLLSLEPERQNETRPFSDT